MRKIKSEPNKKKAETGPIMGTYCIIIIFVQNPAELILLDLFQVSPREVSENCLHPN